MAKIDWESTTNRLVALREDIEGVDSQETEVEETETNEEVEALTALQLHALAEMLGVDADTLVEAEAEVIYEAMQYLGYKLCNTQYGRSGLSGKYPWNRNEGEVGVATQHASPSKTSAPGDSTAKVPKAASSNPFAQKGQAHRTK